MNAILLVFLVPFVSLVHGQEQDDQIAALSQRLDRFADELNKERSQRQMQYNSFTGQINSLKHELADERILRRALNDKLVSLLEAGNLEHGVGGDVAPREDLAQIEDIKQIKRNISELNDKYAKLEKDVDFLLRGSHGDSEDFSKFSLKFASRFESLAKGFQTLKEQSYEYADRIEDLEKDVDVISNNLTEYRIKTNMNEKKIGGIIQDIKKLLLSMLELDSKLSRIAEMRTTVFSTTTILPGKRLSSGAELASILKPGMRVVRGPDWKWGTQDGDKPGPGTVVNIKASGWVLVKWDAGREGSYRMHDGKYDLAVYTPTT